jgi:hypothetical protein
MRSRLLPAALAAAAVLSVVPATQAGSDVKLFVLVEHQVGTAAQAQPYLDKLVEVAKDKQGWSSASGKYFTDRSQASAFIDSDKPGYGILTLAAYLSLHDSKSLEAIGSVTLATGGGQQYFLVSKDASDLGGCKGKKLATVFSDDTKFVDKVVSGGAFALSDFNLDAMKRPLQPLKAVIKGEDTCALIDDAQYAELSHMDGGGDLRKVWSSASLPPTVVVALPNAPDKKSFSGNLGSLCSGAGQKACDEVGIRSIKWASEADDASVRAAYSK